ncbi:hypothetical protein QCM77_25080 [Bradyrhizobium sp. SSUT18]|uniref:hypothetical protein n=1 Tax=unclassified Bradyrhizobium TaxID=2631580 RepID=UPI0024494280|nr:MULTISPECIES: hypothetical protein [unclassified Bradyrhizobium]MDH2354486.1 hypothetical protein [Bradyrhizobium sp. SSUT112]MDH2403196.1 hypothetical protein [Bradyrhizobium sp. SSUT18]
MTGRNEGTLAFFNRVQERCAEIASLPPSRQDAAISKLCKETGLTPITIAPIVERYAHQRVPDYPLLAKQFCERMGREKVRTMLATNHGMRDLKHNVQTTLADERLSLTGPRVSLFIHAIKSEFQTASPPELIV